MRRALTSANVGRSPSDAVALKLAGLLLLGGFLLQFAVTVLWHPSGNEDVHEQIFAEYAASDAWVAVHIGQFVGVLAALGGLLIVCRLASAGGESAVAARFAVGALAVTASIWAVLQGLDGVALKEAVDSWAATTGPEKATKFATAETIRWLEWGFQSYFRMSLGLSFALVGVLILSGRPVRAWLGALAVVAGIVSAANGVGVGYGGLDSASGGLADTAFALLAGAFAVGVLVSAFRMPGAVSTVTAQHV